MKFYSLALIFLATVACGQAKPKYHACFLGRPFDHSLSPRELSDACERLERLNKSTVPPNKMCNAMGNICASFCPQGYEYRDSVDRCDRIAPDPAPKPELMDVPAVLVGMDVCTSQSSPDCVTTQHYSCADKRRILLTDESGGKHCVAFPKESK